MNSGRGRPSPMGAGRSARPGRRLRYVKRHGSGPNPGLVIFTALIAIIIAVSFFVIFSKKGGEGPAYFETETERATAETERVKDPFFRIEVPSSGVSEGDLILVNYDHPYVFPEKTGLVNVYANKTDDFKVAYTNYELEERVLDRIASLAAELRRTTGEKDLTVNSAYRSLEDQRDVWDMYEREQGIEAARLYVAEPGKSEHHTGFAVDLTVVRDDGSAVSIRDCGHYEEIDGLLVDYGFVLRYPGNKKDVTHIENEPWHYRYVGEPHSRIMTRTGLCLEEYVGFLKEYTADGTVLFLGPDGLLTSLAFDEAASASDGYIVLFVPAESGEYTRIAVPDDAAEYLVSGNNSDGFVVTVKLGDADDGIASVAPSVSETVKKHVITD